LHKRDHYLKLLVSFQDQPLIKVITGMRRSGKSYLMALYRNHLLHQGISENRIITMNFESFDFADITNAKQLYTAVRSKINSADRHYILLDEVQLVDQWEKAVNAFRVDLDADITITGSNAYLLSSELSTLIAGRYVEIRLLPLSFQEYLDFSGQTDQNERMAAFGRYLRYGSLPTITSLPEDPEVIRIYLSGIYNTVMMKDVIARNKIRDGALLHRVMVFLAKNIGNPISAKSISDYLTSSGHKISAETVDSYLDMLENAFIIYRADRYDARGKTILKKWAKYYIVDTGIRNELLGFGNADFGRVYENIVYFELIRRGYQVTIGKVDNLEVDFVATKSDKTAYYQVAATLADPNTRQRELRSLLDIRDNYEKVILSMDTYPYPTDEQGVLLRNIVDFLQENK